MQLITRLGLGLNHLLENKFRYNLQDTLNPIYGCGADLETTIHYISHRLNFLNE